MPVSEDLIRTAWSRDREPVAQLVTITSAAEPEPIRATDWPEGITTGGVEYPFFPFSLSWAGRGKDDPFGGGKLTISNVDGRIEEACDAAPEPPAIDLAIVRVASPDYVEKALVDARIPSVSGDSGEVRAVIRPRDFALEPCVARVYGPATTPGLL